MKISLLTAAFGLTIAGVLSVPAVVSAQIDRPPRRDAVVDIAPRPVPEPEQLRLHCAGRLADNGRAAVVCEWSQTERRDAAAYVLVRTDGDQRTVVFKTRNLEETRAVDTEVRIGVRYKYSVLVRNAEGRTIGSGGPVTAGVEKPDPELEVLDMKCAQRAPGVAVVVCEWRPATSEAAAGYQLWRIVDRGEREVVWRGGLDTTSHVSRVPEDAKVVRYAVLAVDAGGHTVGQSRPQTVVLRPGDRPIDRPVDRITDVSDVRPVRHLVRSGFRTYI